MEKFDGEKPWRIKHAKKFDKQNFDKSILGFVKIIVECHVVASVHFLWPQQSSDLFKLYSYEEAMR